MATTPSAETGDTNDNVVDTTLELSSESRNWATFAHLSAFVMFLGIPSLIGPLVVWLAKKDDPYVEAQAKEALNFNISMLIYAIAAGISDGLGFGANARAALITRGLAEVTRLGSAMGGKPETFAGLAGMGDMIATCTSPQSRNRHVGIELGKGRNMQEIIDEMVMVAEGAKSAPAVIALAEQYQVEMPIARDVYRVVSGETNARGAYRGLLRVAAGAESEPG